MRKLKKNWKIVSQTCEAIHSKADGSLSKVADMNGKVDVVKSFQFYPS